MTQADQKKIGPPEQIERPWWWLSFADGKRPGGSQFLGVAIVGPAQDIMRAALIAHRLGVNPGGEVQGLPVPAAMLSAIPAEWRGRLMTRREAMALDRLIGAARATE